MALVRWNPRGQNVTLRDDVRDDIECFLEDVFRGNQRPWNGQWTTSGTRAFTPRVDLKNLEKEVVLRADLPGIEKEDLDISVTHEVVTIKGERKVEETDENECYYCQESTYGAFERIVPLPEEVSSEEANATLKNGVLTLRLPKAKPRTQVKIEVN